MRIATTLCLCGHALSYHDTRELAGAGLVEICSVWGCGCTEYEVEE